MVRILKRESHVRILGVIREGDILIVAKSDSEEPVIYRRGVESIINDYGGRICIDRLDYNNEIYITDCRGNPIRGLRMIDRGKWIYGGIEIRYNRSLDTLEVYDNNPKSGTTLDAILPQVDPDTFDFFGKQYKIEELAKYLLGTYINKAFFRKEPYRVIKGERVVSIAKGQAAILSIAASSYVPKRVLVGYVYIR